jgi:hypothetical protein
MANSGEESGQPGGAVGSGTGGELERRPGDIYRRGQELETAGGKCILKRGSNGELGLGHRRRKWLREGDDRWVPPVGEGEREEGCTGSGEGFLGHGPVSCLGRFGSPWPSSIFLFFSIFFFFCFLYFFISFSNLIQNTSNKILSHSNNQHSVLNQ